MKLLSKLGYEGKLQRHSLVILYFYLYSTFLSIGWRHNEPVFVLVDTDFIHRRGLYEYTDTGFDTGFECCMG
jgi:hypothetical protein